ncbi:DUF5642 family protein [Mycolicibacterium hodleri]|uniref:DUF5642 domain-containing protein n=1 Tax=Mycolicibacterium hodleri TaxID=49897 RepID=A0A502E4R5_9MYCO|nr:DUF5642 family protein [Mycolicibacterium hodleri]TPG31949.1 hypothetical protein EAH80_21565 [Mycolicibacterium hodleri]
MVALRGGVVLPLVLSAGLAMTGCSATSETKDATSVTAPRSTSSTGAPSHVDLARLAKVRNDFPPGFMPAPPSAPRKTRADEAKEVGNTVSYGRPFTVDPRQCRALFEPVVGQAGADTMGVGAVGPDQQLIAVSVDDPVVVSAAPPSAGCTRMSFEVDDDAMITNGVAERLAAPSIDGAATTALKVTSTGFAYAEYFYAAILDGRTFIRVTARVHPDFQAEPVLADLLVNGVAAVSGR